MLLILDRPYAILFAESDKERCALRRFAVSLGELQKPVRFDLSEDAGPAHDETALTLWEKPLLADIHAPQN